MQNQIYNEADNQVKNQPGSQKTTKYYVLGLITGILAAMALVFIVIGAASFFRIINPIKIRGNTAGSARAGESSSITDEGVRKKLEILEDTIGDLFWKDVDEAELEEGLYRDRKSVV